MIASYASILAFRDRLPLGNPHDRENKLNSSCYSNYDLTNMRIAIVCDTDPIWAVPTWHRTLASLSAGGHEIVGLWGVPETFPKRLGGSQLRWFLKVFGIRTTCLLGVYGALTIFRNLLTIKTTSLSGICRKVATPYHAAASPNTADTIEALKRANVDVIIAMTSHILKGEILDLAPLGIVNKHAALLPDNKGVYPYFWAYLDSAPQGVSFHLMDKGIDTGPVLFQQRYAGAGFDSMIGFYEIIFADYDWQLLAALKNLTQNTLTNQDRKSVV